MPPYAVLLKPSPQTPLTGERLVRAFHAAGVPSDVVQCLHLSPNLVARAVQHPRVGFVSFTGSVAGGRAVEQAATASATATSSATPDEGIFPLSFKGVALELGGKDPAYVREDADLEYTVEQLVDGAFFNSGQSCCSIEVSCDRHFLGVFVGCGGGGLGFWISAGGWWLVLGTWYLVDSLLEWDAMACIAWPRVEHA
jgi:delta 1-pyrroline-5-carboxylate dehydrogenase